MKENFVSSKNIIDKRASVIVELQATKDKVMLKHIWTFLFPFISSTTTLAFKYGMMDVDGMEMNAL